MIVDYFFYLVYNVSDFFNSRRLNSQVNGCFVLSLFFFLNARSISLYLKIPVLTGNIALDGFLCFSLIYGVLSLRYMYRSRYLEIVEKFRGKGSYLGGFGLIIVAVYCVLSVYFSFYL